jgi:hypothetical protein
VASRNSISWIAAVVPLIALAAEPSWRITPTKVEDYPGGFRCYFHSPSESPDTPHILFQTNDEGGDDTHALIGIDGTKVLLDRVDLRRRSKNKNSDSVGDRLQVRFTGHDVSVVLDATITGACPANSENCEDTQYRAKITVTKDGSSESLDVVGDCGV